MIYDWKYLCAYWLWIQNRFKVKDSLKVSPNKQTQSGIAASYQHKTVICIRLHVQLLALGWHQRKRGVASPTGQYTLRCRPDGGSSSRVGHLSLTESDGQLQVLLLLLSQPLQSLTFRSLTFSFGPFQLLSLVPKLQDRVKKRSKCLLRKGSSIFLIEDGWMEVGWNSEQTRISFEF